MVGDGLVGLGIMADAFSEVLHHLIGRHPRIILRIHLRLPYVLFYHFIPSPLLVNLFYLIYLSLYYNKKLSLYYHNLIFNNK